LAYGQVVRRLPDIPQSATAIAENGNDVWVGTSTGAYRVDGDNFVRIPDFRLDIRGISVIDGVVWLATTQGAYRVDGNLAHRTPDIGLVVTSVNKIGSRIWLATTTGAYLLDGDTAHRTPDRDLDVANITSIDNNPWLATDRGAFRLSLKMAAPAAGGVAKPAWVAEHVVNLDYDLNQILEIDGVPWLATDHGAFRIDPTGPKHIALFYPSNPTFTFPGKKAEVFRIIPAGGRIWFISTTGCFRVDGDRAIRIPDANNSISTVVPGPGANPSVWIATRTGAYRVDGDVVKHVPNQSLDVSGVTVVNGHVWLATTTGAYLVDGDTARRIPDDPLSVSSITDAGGKALLSTSTGAVVVEDADHYYHVLAGGSVLGSNIAGGNVWLSASTGAFRVDTEDRLRLRLVPLGGGWRSAMQRLLPKGRVSGTYGVKVVTVDDRAGAVRDLPDALVQVGRSTAFVDPATVRLNLRPGNQSIDALVQVGQTPPIGVGIRVHVVPVWLVPVAVIIGVWLGFALIVFATAPFAAPAWRLMMRPSFRGVGSLGLISALLLNPAARRYLLIRYRRGLTDALGQEPGTGDLPLADVGARLSSNRFTHVDAIVGAEPFVTACHIARRALARERDLGAARTAVPVPVLVAGDEARDLDGLIPPILSDNGGFTDPKLVMAFVERGGFLFILEGDTPTTLDDKQNTTALVDAFIQAHSRRNFICVVRREG